jgi:hypothetical protein
LEGGVTNGVTMVQTAKTASPNAWQVHLLNLRVAHGGENGGWGGGSVGREKGGYGGVQPNGMRPEGMRK